MNIINPANGNNYILTFSGKKFYPLNPCANDIDIADISHALSNQCRFAGHCKSFFSIAQHSAMVAYMCTDSACLAGLLHDASEAYLVDIPRPLKVTDTFAGYREAEGVLQSLINKKFNIQEIQSIEEIVKLCDNASLKIEINYLLFDNLNFKFSCLNPMESNDLFLNSFSLLTDGKIEQFRDLVTRYISSDMTSFLDCFTTSNKV